MPETEYREKNSVEMITGGEKQKRNQKRIIKKKKKKKKKQEGGVVKGLGNRGGEKCHKMSELPK